jgi:bifunctional isochorismate lyase/aryl carrier protein
MAYCPDKTYHNCPSNMEKETYFTPSSIGKTSLDMLKNLQEYRHRHKAIHLRPEASALLVLDVQTYFFDEASHAFIPSSLAILPRIINLVHRYTICDLPVIFTRHINTTQDAKLMAIWWKDLIRQESLNGQLVPELNTSGGVVLNKSQYDAFFETPLEEILCAKKIRQVVICGVMTHLCCETTARSAFMRGFEVFFTVDGTATYTQAFHQATLLTLSHGFAVPILVEEILAAL